MYKVGVLADANTNPQSGSASSSSGGEEAARNAAGAAYRSLPTLFLYIETGDWKKAANTARRHPREVKTWASIRSKSSGTQAPKISGAKRLALHQACLKLRSCTASTEATYNPTEDQFVEVCKFIMLLLDIYPEAASMRESRHGCLPLHLAAFASCTLASNTEEGPSSNGAFDGMGKMAQSLLNSAGLSRPVTMQAQPRSLSSSSTDAIYTTISGGLEEEMFAGAQTEYHNTSAAVEQSNAAAHNMVSVSMGSNILISEKREEWAVRVLNKLLDAYPKAIRVASEGGRLPLHTACAGRATPRVVTTLITANPSAARHRNKDGFLPLHLSAHWGISHPNVVTALLKTYPDATFGRNRWERTPLEEALSMAGENGRPHQASLVRALRKHPSYWTRPVDVFQNSGRRNRSQLVDVDESLPSFEDDSMDESNFGGMYHNTRNGEGVEVTSMADNLATLIKAQNWNGVLAKLEANPGEAEMALQVTTRGGFTSTANFSPLHYACERRPPLQVVEALIAACPGAVAIRSMPGGALPMHVACTWYADSSVIDALLRADRAACRTPDELGNLPLHSACFSGTDTKVSESLLRVFPKGTLVRNHQGSLPEEITKRLRNTNRRSMLALLNLCKGEVLAKRDAKHRRNRSDGYFNSPSTQRGVSPKGGEDLVWI